jgi:hypothetical protein
VITDQQQNYSDEAVEQDEEICGKISYEDKNMRYNELDCNADLDTASQDTLPNVHENINLPSEGCAESQCRELDKTSSEDSKKEKEEVENNLQAEEDVKCAKLLDDSKPGSAVIMDHVSDQKEPHSLEHNEKFGQDESNIESCRNINKAESTTIETFQDSEVQSKFIIPPPPPPPPPGYLMPLGKEKEQIEGNSGKYIDKKKADTVEKVREKAIMLWS